MLTYANVCGQVGARISERDRLLREKQVKQHRDSLQKRGVEVRQVYVTCVCVCVCVCVDIRLYRDSVQKRGVEMRQIRALRCGRRSDLKLVLA